MNKSESIKELATALSKAQAMFTGAVKDSTNPHYKSKFASLESVVDALSHGFKENGLSYSQLTDIKDGALCIETVIMHSSGEWICGTYPLNAIKQDPQGQGSAMTYARRYALTAACGIYQVDDDGEAAQGRTTLTQSHMNAPTAKIPGVKYEPSQGAKAEATNHGTAGTNNKPAPGAVRSSVPNDKDGELFPENNNPGPSKNDGTDAPFPERNAIKTRVIEGINACDSLEKLRVFWVASQSDGQMELLSKKEKEYLTSVKENKKRELS